MPLSAGAYAIARYKLIDWLRRHGRHDSLYDPLEDIHEGASAQFSYADEAAGEARHDLAKLLALLPDKQRDAIIITKLNGLSAHEASDILGMSFCLCLRLLDAFPAPRSNLPRWSLV